MLETQDKYEFVKNIMRFITIVLWYKPKNKNIEVTARVRPIYKILSNLNLFLML